MLFDAIMFFIMPFIHGITVKHSKHTVNDGIDLHIRLVTILIATNRDNMHRDERVELTTGDRMNR